MPTRVPRDLKRKLTQTVIAQPNKPPRELARELSASQEQSVYRNYFGEIRRHCLANRKNAQLEGELLILFPLSAFCVLSFHIWPGLAALCELCDELRSLCVSNVLASSYFKVVSRYGDRMRSFFFDVSGRRTPACRDRWMAYG